MHSKKKIHPQIKSQIHPRNKHRERYDFKVLSTAMPVLAKFVKINEYGDESIDFFNPEAVKMLNRALLKHFYKIDYWDIPASFLCPPIPGRADYIHYAADLLGKTNQGKIPAGAKITILDVGVGANMVYPIIGTKEYGWSFVGSDINPQSIEAAQHIIDQNPSLDTVKVRLQNNSRNIFKDIIQSGERFDLTVCNPPFHSSAAEANAGSIRKLKNLKQKQDVKLELNFGGQNNELWCNGGEERFVKDMIFESRNFAQNCLWFSSLISKEAHLKSIYRVLAECGATQVETIPMSQGNKISRIVAWSFLPAAAHVAWAKERW
jgi:23S rRNA (adenine1618-N6)-methyltransferase